MHRDPAPRDARQPAPDLPLARIEEAAALPRRTRGADADAVLHDGSPGRPRPPPASSSPADACTPRPSTSSGPARTSPAGATFRMRGSRPRSARRAHRDLRGEPRRGGRPGRRPPAASTRWSSCRRRPCARRWRPPGLRRRGDPRRAATRPRRGRRWSGSATSAASRSSTRSTHPDIIAGQGTVGLEIVEDLPDVDVVVAGSAAGARLRRRGGRQGAPAGGARLRRRAADLERPRAAGSPPDARADPPGRASPTGSTRRSPASGRSTSAGGYSTTSCCSTTRRSWRGCASRWSG